MYDPVFAQWKYKNPKYWDQFGGAKVRKIIKDDIEYKFYKRYHYDETIYALHSKDNKDINCILIIVNKKHKTAYIHELGNNKGCIKIGQIKEKGGSILMKVALKLVNEIKKKYKLEYVYLTDNANKTFYDNNNDSFDITLSNLLFFTKGKTYYERYGFVPINESIGNVSMDEDIIRIYEEEKSILQKPISKLKINTNSVFKRIDKKYKELLDNIIRNKNDKRMKNVNITTFLKYYINKKEYIPIIDELLKNIIIVNKIMIPKMWGMKL